MILGFYMLEVSVLIISIAFVFLVIYLCFLISRLIKTIKKVNVLIESVHQKTNSFDPLFQAIFLLSDSILEKTKGIKAKEEMEKYAELRGGSSSQTDIPTLAHAMEWITIGVSIWQALKKRR